MQRVFVLALAVCSTAAIAFGQNIVAEPFIGFSLRTPVAGARALGMGGASLAFGDDATAVLRNPALLGRVQQPVFDLEVRRSENTVRVPASGTYPNVNYVAQSGSAIEPSFIGLAVPRGRLTLAAYYSTVTHTRNDVNPGQDTLQIFFIPGVGSVGEKACTVDVRCQPFATSLDLTTLDFRVRNFGVSAAWHAENYALGLGIRRNTFSQRSSVTYGSDTYALNGRGSGYAVDAGLLVDVTPQVTLAFEYQEGTRIEPKGADSFALGTGTIHLPDRVGAGAAIRPAAGLTITADVVSVEYSDLTDTMMNTGIGLPSDFRVADGYELHTGAEYILRTRRPFAVRAGWWREPAHSIAFGGNIVDAWSLYESVLFPRGDASHHWTAGAGLPIGRVRLDLAYDHSRSSNDASVQIGARF